MEKDYGTKIDVWSIGAIFGEMMKMKEENPQGYESRKPFFPGRSCYPLSPDKRRRKQSSKTLSPGEKKSKSSKVADDDQLSVILSTIGPLTEEDMSFLSASKQTQYLKQFDIKDPETSIREQLPWESGDALDLISRMLQFNPYFRISIEDALKHDYFKDMEVDDEVGEIPGVKLNCDLNSYNDLPEQEL